MPYLAIAAPLVQSTELECSSVTTLDNKSDLALRQLQRKLEKDRTEMEWKLKEYGWRLDQASAVSNIAMLPQMLPQINNQR